MAISQGLPDPIRGEGMIKNCVRKWACKKIYFIRIMYGGKMQRHQTNM